MGYSTFSNFISKSCFIYRYFSIFDLGKSGFLLKTDWDIRKKERVVLWSGLGTHGEESVLVEGGLGNAEKKRFLLKIR